MVWSFLKKENATFQFSAQVPEQLQTFEERSLFLTKQQHLGCLQ